VKIATKAAELRGLTVVTPVRIVIARSIRKDVMKVSKTIVIKVGVGDVTLGAVKDVGMTGMTEMTTGKNLKRTQGSKTSVPI
jgi:hypothetical protein